ncbi:hypothetical protein D3C84_760610 [compost metagenome]
MRAGTATFYSGVPYVSDSVTVDYTFWIKDMYVTEKTGDGSPNGPLGPQRIYPISVATIDQATWAASPSGDNVAALNSPISDAASQLTPVVVSDPAIPSANVTLSPAAFVGPVNAVVLRMTARRHYTAV